MDKQLEGKKVTMKKLRHVQGKFSRNVEGYIEKMAVKDVARVMRTRLEMWDIGKNLGGIDRICCNKNKRIRLLHRRRGN